MKIENKQMYVGKKAIFYHIFLLFLSTEAMRNLLQRKVWLPH